MRRLVCWGLAFISVSVLLTLNFWWEGDWWVYVEKTSEGGRRVPKFEVPLAVQLIISSLFGAIAGGAITVLMFLATRIWVTIRRVKREWKGVIPHE
jgi:hypothetical protein